MLPGFRVHDLEKNVDEGGFFAEIFRQDWKDLLGIDEILQTNLFYSYPGMIRAWHRHDRGRVDYITVLRGALKICAYDDRAESQTRGQLTEAVTSEERLQVVRVPGFYWHGTKALGENPTLAVYCVNRLYNPMNPDEERRPWNDNAIKDPRTGKPYDWNMPSHR